MDGIPRSFGLFLVGSILPVFRDQFHGEGYKVAIVRQQRLLDILWSLIERGAGRVIACDVMQDLSAHQVSVTTKSETLSRLYKRYHESFLVYGDAASWVVWSIDPDLGFLIADMGDFKFLKTSPEETLSDFYEIEGRLHYSDLVERNLKYFNSTLASR